MHYNIQLMTILGQLDARPKHHSAALRGQQRAQGSVFQSLCYVLPNARDQFDVGVRLKQDLQDKLDKLRDQLPDFEVYRASLDYLVATTSRPELCAQFPMESGNLILIDNNRFAHGRCHVVGEREVGGQTILNSRELWSVSVA